MGGTGGHGTQVGADLVMSRQHLMASQEVEIFEEAFVQLVTIV